MSVGQNVEYGLKVKKRPAHERRERIAQALALVRLEGFEDHSLAGFARFGGLFIPVYVAWQAYLRDPRRSGTAFGTSSSWNASRPR
jgi:hypothetical protein